MWLAAYAIAMAYVEAALVIALRKLHYADPLALFPLVPLSGADLGIELVRELATVIMIAVVACLHAGRGARAFAAFMYVFGLWDIAYYAWLELLLGWPTSWTEWDVLFLIPWPWLGPWIAAALVAALLVVAGGYALTAPAPKAMPRTAVVSFAIGAAIVVGSFLAAGLPLVAGGGLVAGYRPGAFAWTAFAAGYAAMTAGLFIGLSPETWRRP